MNWFSLVFDRLSNYLDTRLKPLFRLLAHPLLSITLPVWHSPVVRHMRALVRWLLQRFARAVQYLCWLIFILWWALLLLVAGLRFVILPHIDDYRPQLEQLLSQRVGRTVTIDEVQASWRGLNPELQLVGLKVAGPADDPSAALSFPHISAVGSWRSLLVADLRLNSLEISTSNFTIERFDQKHLRLAGFVIDLAKPSDGKLLRLLLAQREIRLRTEAKSAILWRDHVRQAPDLPLENVQFVLRNQGTLHQLALHIDAPKLTAKLARQEEQPHLATPNNRHTAPFVFQANFHHPWWQRASTWQQWYGQVYASLPAFDASRIEPYLDIKRAIPTYPLHRLTGYGRAQAWLDFAEQKLTGLTGDVDLHNVTVQFLGKEKHTPKPLAIEAVQGRGGWQITPKGLRVFSHGFSLREDPKTADAVTLQPLTLHYQGEWHDPRGQPLKEPKHSLRLNELDLNTLHTLLNRLPILPDLHNKLDRFQPEGTLMHLQADLQGPLSAPVRYQLKTDFHGLGWRAQDNPAHTAEHPHTGLPGVEQAAGSAQINELGGQVFLTIKDGALVIPGVWEEPRVPLDELHTTLSWQKLAKQKDAGRPLWEVRIPTMHLANADAMGSIDAVYQTGGKGLGVVDLNATFSRANGGRAARYLPLVLSSQVRQWVAENVQAADARNMQFRVKGDLLDIPHGDSKLSTFRISSEVDKLKLGIGTGWPVFEQGRGNIVFDQHTFQANLKQASVLGAQVRDTKVKIGDLLHSVVEVEGTAQGSLQNFLQYVQRSPLDELLSQSLHEAQGNGEANLQLKLALPIAELDKSKIQGLLQVKNAELTLQPEIPSIQKTAGRIEFTERGFTLRGINGITLGGPIRVEGGTRQDGATQIRLEGNITPSGLNSYMPHPAWSRLTGSTRYTGNVIVSNGTPAVQFESTLQGISSSLPTPFAKTANEVWPLRVETVTLATNTPERGGKTSAKPPTVTQDEIRLAINTPSNQNIRLRLERMREKGKENSLQIGGLKIVRAALGINDQAELPVSAGGLSLAINLPQIDLDVWRKILDDTTAEAAKQGAQPVLALTQVRLRSNDVTLFSRQYSGIDLTARHANQAWEATLDSPSATGYFIWRDRAGKDRAGRLVGRMTKLYIPKGDIEEKSPLTNTTEEDLPALDLAVEDFRINQKELGRLELIALNTARDSGRVWQVQKLLIENPQASLNATGSWRQPSNTNMRLAESSAYKSQTQMKFTLQGEDYGGLVDRLGFPNTLRRGNGKITGELRWRGAPTAFDPSSLDGELDLDIGRGQFLKVDAGAGKLLGVLSLQALPRRLLLDFRDVFSQGFAFDAINGQVKIENGVARTNTFKMKSPAAIVAIEGSANLGKETQDLHVVVVPDTNPGIATLAYGLANPIVGLGAFVGQFLLREPLAKAFTFEYQVTGTWDDPQVEKLDKKTERKSEKGATP